MQRYLIDEAEDILLKGDVSSLYQITDDYSEMCITPKNADELIELLQRRHAILKEERTAKRHGEFKIKEIKTIKTFNRLVGPNEGDSRIVYECKK